MNSEEFRETFLRNDREGPTKAEKAEKMAENNAWERNSRRGNSQPRAAGAREANPVGSVRSTGGEGNNTPREAKRKTGLSGRKRKAGSPEKAKSGSRRGGRRKARKIQLQPSQGPSQKAQEEKDTTYVGVLHVSSRAEWACHMSECTKAYHALRECDFFRSPLREQEG